MNGFTVQASDTSGSARKGRFVRILFPVFIVLIMLGGVLGFGAYRQYRESLRQPWLELTSTPPGATVFLNGRWVGATPLRLEDLESGTYAARFEKQGHEPVLRRLEIEKPGCQVAIELQPVATGRLTVEVQPKGAEVLLDGVLVGHTPITLNHVAAGPHELLVRRTNFQPYLRRLNLKGGETQTFAGVAMQDLILKALQERRLMEPWRISNATELATYLFLNDQQTAAAETVMQAIDVTINPPAFPAEMLPEDRANEQRLRGNDQGHLNHMVTRMWSWPEKDAAPFRKRMEEPDASLRVLAFRLHLHDRGNATQTAQRLLARCTKDPVSLTAAVQLISSRSEQIREPDYEPLVRTAEQMARTAYAEDRALGALALAHVLVVRGNAAEALKYLRESLSQTSPETAWEDRALRAVELLQVLGQRDEARQLCERLAKSARAEVRTPAAKQLKRLK